MPEYTKKTVLSKGKQSILMIFIPIGGKTQPIKTLGLILKWKKDQKIEKKKHNFWYYKKNHTFKYP